MCRDDSGSRFKVQGFCVGAQHAAPDGAAQQQMCLVQHETKSNSPVIPLYQKGDYGNAAEIECTISVRREI
jgi:hypothetical protein